MVAGTVDKALENIMKPQTLEGDDYIGEDGLIYCGKCHTRKEKVLDWISGGKRKVSILCECGSKTLEAQREGERKKQEMYNIRRARISSMMDDNFRTATFDNYRTNNHNEKHLKVAKKYCEEFQTMYEKNQGLLFYGTVGTGKSYTAACIANFLLDRHTSVVMTSFVRILQEMKGFDREREEAFTNQLNSVRLLIIDDFGAERSTDYALERVFGIIDSRYRAKKPLILTTNMSLKQMQAADDIRYERIYDRVFEMCYPMEFQGVSWRKREAALRFEETKKLLEE